MEELLRNNLFVQCVFPTHIEWNLWQAITEQSPADFQQEQFKTYELLMGSPQLRQKYLQRFQQNHLNLYGWSLLVTREKADIEPYLFRPLLHRTPSFHNSKLNRAILTFPCRNSHTEPSEARRALERTYRRKEKEGQIGSHELYLQTFEACRGEQYIPYDYAKHMRGDHDRVRYNAFIRQKHIRNHSNPTSPRNTLSQYAEWQHRKEKTALLSFRTVLGNDTLNSQRGLQSMLKRQGSQKLVFVNHQLKPVNYYLRSQLRAGLH